MANIHGIGGSKKKDSKLLEQAGTTSGTATLKGDDKEKNILESLVNKAKFEQNQNARDESIPNVAKIILYRNGFQLGEDGEFFDVKDPKNQKIVEALMAGDVSPELEVKLQASMPPSVTKNNRQVGVDLVNRITQEFVPPKPKFSFSASQGQALHSSDSAKVVSSGAFGSATPKAIVLNDAEPSITVQLILADSSKVRQKFNEKHTVMDVYSHVMFLSKVSSPFNLISGFPPKPLSDPSITVKAAGLSGASVTQKL